MIRCSLPVDSKFQRDQKTAEPPIEIPFSSAAMSCWCRTPNSIPSRHRLQWNYTAK